MAWYRAGRFRSEPMKPLHIVNACFVGRYGLADYTLSLARALHEHCRSTIVTAVDFDYPQVEFSGEVVRLFRRTRHYPLDLWRFLRRMLALSPDVLVFQAPLKLPLLDAVVARLLRASGIRVATTVHDVLPHYPRAWSRAEYRFFYRSFDRLVAHSDDALQRLRALGIDAPILVVPHGEYDIYRLSGLERHEARARIGGLGDDDFVALFFGRIDERKGIAELLDFAEALDPGSPTKLIVAGFNAIDASNSTLRARFDASAKLAQCRVVANGVPFQQVELYFAAADVVLLPYLEGTTSGVLKLAMAFGKPVIATDVGDVPETVNSDAGIVISHRHMSEELAPAMQHMQQHYEQFRRRWQAAREPYAWSGIGQRYFEFLSDGLPA